MELEKVKTEILKIDPQLKTELADESTIHICYGSGKHEVFVCAIQNKDNKWGFSTDADVFTEYNSFRNVLKRINEWWDCTEGSVTSRLSDEQLINQSFTDDSDVIRKRLEDYTNYFPN